MVRPGAEGVATLLSDVYSKCTVAPCSSLDSEYSQCWSNLKWSNPSGMTAAADAMCPRTLWNCFSGTTFLPLKEFRQFITSWVHSSVRQAVILTESNSTLRREILCTGESLLFSQLTQSPNWLRCRSTKSLWLYNVSQDWAKISQCRGSWGPWHPLPVAE